MEELHRKQNEIGTIKENLNAQLEIINKKQIAIIGTAIA